MKFLLTILLALSSLAVIAQQNNVANLYNEGFAFYRKGEKLKALELFGKIYAADTSTFDALEYQSMIYGETGQFAKSAAGFAKLASLFPKRDDYFSSACYNYILINQPERAEYFGKKAVSLNARRYNNLLNLAHTYLLRNKVQEANYWYIRALQWVPSKAAFERSFMGDFKELDSLKLLPSATISRFKAGLIAEFEALNMASKASIYLDSILSYTNKSINAAEQNKLVQWKIDFIEEEVTAAIVRTDVVAAFAGDIGMYEYGQRSRAVALTYFDRAAQIYKGTADSLSMATMLIFVSKEILAYQLAENKYGKNIDAHEYALEGWQLVEQYGLEDLKTAALYQLAETYFQKTENEKGRNCLWQLLAWANKRNDSKAQYLATNSLSVYYNENHTYDSALYYNKLCLSQIEYSGVTKEEIASIKVNGLNMLYGGGKYTEAIKQCKIFLPQFMQLNTGHYSSVCELIGLCYEEKQQFDSAYTYYKIAVESFMDYSDWIEKQKDKTWTLQVSDTRHTSLEGLCSIAAARNNLDSMFYWAETNKENFLRYLMSNQYQPRYITTLADAKQSLPEDAAALVYVATGLQKAPCLAFNKSIGKIGWIDRKDVLAGINQKKLTGTFDKLLQMTNKKAKTSMDSLMSIRLLPLMQYFYLSNINPIAARGVIPLKRADEPTTAALNIEKTQLARLLYEIYIQPFEAIIKGKKTLYISADLLQHFIPFETLVMPDGKYLAEVYDIIYTPSFTINYIMSTRTYNEGTSIVALGNPDYSTYHPAKLKGRALDFSISSGLKSWSDLPGTQQEINMLQQQFESATIYTQNKLSETGLKQLSSDGKLGNAAILHFALHGIAGTQTAKEDNSIVVTEPDDGIEDGLLQFYEAFELDIKPQLVCLSACETALGMAGSDGSLITMGSAFLAAGAKAVLATNWTIDDAGTSVFIRDVYLQVKEQKIGFAQAVANTKRRFIKGDFGEKYKKPFYWAPFKYYGL